MFNLTGSTLKIGGLCLCLAAVSGNALADDVKNSIEEAMEYYQEGAYKDAVESLNYASQLIQQMKGKQLEAFLPTVDGWSVSKAESKSIGASMLGGGITVEGYYRKDTSSVSVQMITDSPMMQTMIMMISNPMIATADGGQLQRIGREKAIVKYDEEAQSGEIRMVVADAYLITIEGKQVDEDTLIGFAEAIDFKKLKDL